MLALQFLDISFLASQIVVNLFSIEVIIGQRAVDLCDGKVWDLLGDFLGGVTELKPGDDSSNRNAGTGDTGPPAADFRRSGDQCSDVGDHSLLPTTYNQ
jgi:hypothetical protein